MKLLTLDQAPEAPAPAAPRAPAGVRPANFPVESPEERTAAAQRSLAVMRMQEQEYPNDPDLKADIVRVSARAGGVAAPLQQIAVSDDGTSASVASTGPAEAPQKPPAWGEIEASRKYQALDSKGQDSVRESFWRDVVSPLVETKDLDEARKAFDERTKPSLLKTAVKVVKDAAGAVADAVRGADAPQQALVPLLDAAELERPARMTVSRAGQPQLENAPAPAQGGIEEPPNAPKSLGEQYASILKPETPRPGGLDRFAVANERGRATLDADRGTFNAAEQQQRAGAKAANDIANADYWRNVGNSIQNVHPMWKQVMGGALRALGEGMPEDPRAQGWNALRGEVAKMGADFYDQGEYEIQTNTGALKPGIGAEATGSAIQSMAMMFPALLAGGITKNPATVIQIMSGTTGAQSYGRGRIEGLSPGQAAIYALLQAAIEGGTEYAPMRALFASAPTFGKRFTNFMAKEIPQELLATGLQNAVDKVSIEPGMTWAEYTHDLLVTLLSTPISGGAQAGGVHLAQRAAERWAQVAAADPAAATPAEVKDESQTGDTKTPGEPTEAAGAVPVDSVLGAEEGEQPAAPSSSDDDAPEPPDGGQAVQKKFSDELDKTRKAAEERKRQEEEEPPAIKQQRELREKAAQESSLDDAAQGLKKIFESPTDEKAHGAAPSPHNDLPEPTPAQKEAGNYTKGHIALSGLDISIENPAESERKGVDPSGKPWSVTLKSHYGYIRGTVGKDKAHIDVFIKPGTNELAGGSPVFVIDQKKAGNGHFDEHKVMLGFDTQEEAEAAYKANYSKDWDGIRATVPMDFAGFKHWLKEGDTTRPAAETLPEGEPEKLILPMLGKNDGRGVPSAEINLQKFGNGKWGYGGGYQTNISGEGSPTVWDSAKHASRDDALNAAIDYMLKRVRGDKPMASDQSNQAHPKHVDRIITWLNSQRPKKPGKPLFTITVQTKAIEAETGKVIVMNEQADVALRDVDEQITKSKLLLECLRA